MKEIALNEFMQKVNAYRKSRIILTAWELDLFTKLENTNGQLNEIVILLKTDKRATRMLLDVLAAYGLIIKKNNQYFNTGFAKKYLVFYSPDYLSGLGHSNNLWELWSGLTNSVKEGKPFTRDEINEQGETWLENFIEAMHDRARTQATETIGLIDLANVNYVIDIGGGSGAFSMAFVDAKKEIAATVFDLPNVITLTNKYIEKEGYQKSINTISGDYTKDDISSGYDLAFLSAIIHSNSFETNQDLIKKCFHSLNPGGQIVISDFIMNNDRLSPLYGAEFALNMLVATNEGDTYTENEIHDWLLNSGFEKIKRIDLPTKGAMMIGSKPIEL